MARDQRKPTADSLPADLADLPDVLDLADPVPGGLVERVELAVDLDTLERGDR